MHTRLPDMRAKSAAAGLRTWAQGAADQEAGVELLIRAFDGRFAQQGCPWVRPCGQRDIYCLDVHALVEQLGAFSTGERAVLSLVAALTDARPIADLADLLASLNRQHRQLVYAALEHVAGPHAELVRRGDELVLVTPPALVAWPTDRRRVA